MLLHKSGMAAYKISAAHHQSTCLNVMKKHFILLLLLHLAMYRKWLLVPSILPADRHFCVIQIYVCMDVCIYVCMYEHRIY